MNANIVSWILVAYASKHGATAEIAEAIADGLVRRGTEAGSQALRRVDEPSQPVRV
jgi:menaquinone-dependent protoporphyrinogen IX oxidase